MNAPFLQMGQLKLVVTLGSEDTEHFRQGRKCYGGWCCPQLAGEACGAREVDCLCPGCCGPWKSKTKKTPFPELCSPGNRDPKKLPARGCPPTAQCRTCAPLGSIIILCPHLHPERTSHHSPKLQRKPQMCVGGSCEMQS